MSDGVVIRPMRGADLGGVLRIEEAAFSMPWSEATFRGLIRRTDADVLVAECGGATVGHAVFWAVLDEAELGDIAVAPPWRRRGIASGLLRAVVERASRRGVRELFLEVRMSNEAALAFYGKHGFSEVGRREGYYRRPVEDALVLRKVLNC